MRDQDWTRSTSDGRRAAMPIDQADGSQRAAAPDANLVQPDLAASARIDLLAPVGGGDTPQAVGLTIFGDDSANTINGTVDDDIINARGGNDRVNAGAGNDNVNGGDGDDTLYGEGDRDVLSGGLGRDFIFGGDDRDRIFGGDGNDVLYGDAGFDNLRGGDGNDVIYGGDGNDIAFGEAGIDRFTGGAGNDRFDGGAGTLDKAYFSGNFADYRMVYDAGLDQVRIRDIRSGAPDGTDILTGVELLEFADGVAVVNGGSFDFNDAPVFTSATTASVPENQVIAYTATATDPDSPTLTYSLSGGADVALFRINATTGVVAFRTAADFETPGDVGGDNVYDFNVTVSDGSLSTEQAVALTVTDVAEGGSGDLPADTTTTATLALGDTYSNELEVVGDRDWIAVELVAGQRYAISLNGTGGNPLSDPLVRLYDASGSFVAENDDAGPGLNSLLSYTIGTTGTYYIEAAAWDDTVAGGYTVGLETAAPLQEYTNDQIAEYLRSGYWTGNGVAARHWNVSDGGVITVNLVALTAEGQTLARAALDLWSDLTGINFNEVNSGGQMVFDDDQSGAFANSTTSNGIIQSATVNVSTDWLTTYGTDLNSYSFQTYIHEIGHAIGLGHAGPYNGSADYAVDASYLNDSWQASVMSYFSQSENTYVNASYAFVVSPQIADVLAIQNIYGLASSIRAGNTVYGFNSTAGNAIYDATSFVTVVSYTIVDTSGNDTMDYSGSHANQTIDLRAESHSSVQGGTGNVAIARGTVIERAIGGFGDDTLIGNSADNTLIGNGGNDSFYASGGSDVYNGNAGTDTVYFSGVQGDYSVTVNGSGHTVVTDLRLGSPDGVTELISIENIQYGVDAPTLMVVPADQLASSETLAPDASSQGFVGNAALAGLFSSLPGFVGALLGLLPGVYWGPDGMLAISREETSGGPVMRPLDPASIDAAQTLIDNGGPVPVMDVLVLDALDASEKPTAHVDVMPSLTADDLAQVMAIDGGVAGLGTVLTDNGDPGPGIGDLADVSGSLTADELTDFNLPEVSWGLNGLLVLSDGEAMTGAAASPQPVSGFVDLPVFLPEAMPAEDPGGHHLFDPVDGWA